MRLIFAVALVCAALTPTYAGEASCYGYESSRQTASGERFYPDGVVDPKTRERHWTAAMCSLAGCGPHTKPWIALEAAQPIISKTGVPMLLAMLAGRSFARGWASA